MLMISMTPCHFLLMSLGACKFKGEVPSRGRAFKRFHAASVYLERARAIRPETDALALLCHELDSHQKSSHLCLSRLHGHGFAL